MDAHAPGDAINFNPRTPCGVRPLMSVTQPRRPAFQSTHPVRGATVAPLLLVYSVTFQSTHPVRGATRPRLFGRRKVLLISIHAPRAGCDSVCAGHCSSHSNFNPRTPCGVRHRQPRLPGSPKKFQSTHPVRGATTGSHIVDTGLEFQSTHPVRGATAFLASERLLYPISIHAPRAGCDELIMWAGDNPTVISIHAPRAGCDKNAVPEYYPGIFQSTHPVRGATRAGYC